MPVRQLACTHAECTNIVQKSQTADPDLCCNICGDRLPRFKWSCAAHDLDFCEACYTAKLDLLWGSGEADHVRQTRAGGAGPSGSVALSSADGSATAGTGPALMRTGAAVGDGATSGALRVSSGDAAGAAGVGAAAAPLTREGRVAPTETRRQAWYFSRAVQHCRKATQAVSSRSRSGRRLSS